VLSQWIRIDYSAQRNCLQTGTKLAFIPAANKKSVKELSHLKGL